MRSAIAVLILVITVVDCSSRRNRCRNPELLEKLKITMEAKKNMRIKVESVSDPGSLLSDTALKEYRHALQHLPQDFEKMRNSLSDLKYTNNINKDKKRLSETLLKIKEQPALQVLFMSPEEADQINIDIVDASAISQNTDNVRNTEVKSHGKKSKRRAQRKKSN